MAHIKYKVDGKGVVSATADTYVKGRLVRIQARAATTEGDGDSDHGAWGQVTMDLFTKKEIAQNGASERGTKK